MVDIVDITNCARCGEDHAAVERHEFTQPMNIMGVGFTHWASCPKNGEPIIIFLEEGDK